MILSEEDKASELAWTWKKHSMFKKLQEVLNGYSTRVYGEIGAQDDGEMYIEITF